MVDIGSIQAAIGSLQTAGNIAKAAIGLRDTAMTQEKVIELNTMILAAQSSALDAKTEQLALLERISHLEEQMAAMKKWGADKERYKLTQIIPGATAYVLKKSEANGQPVHALCANCYDNGKKSMLQSNGESFIAKHALVCHSCKAAIKTDGAEITEYAD